MITKLKYVKNGDLVKEIEITENISDETKQKIIGFDDELVLSYELVFVDDVKVKELHNLKDIGISKIKEFIVTIK